MGRRGRTVERIGHRHPQRRSIGPLVPPGPNVFQIEIRKICSDGLAARFIWPYVATPANHGVVRDKIFLSYALRQRHGIDVVGISRWLSRAQGKYSVV